MRIKVGISRCGIREDDPKKIKEKANLLNAEIDRLASMGRDTPKLIETLLAETLGGKVCGSDFIERRNTLRQGDLQMVVDVETIRLYLDKCDLRDEIKTAGEKKAKRLEAKAAEREKLLTEQLSAFDSRPADKTSMVRTDKELRQLKEAARSARTRWGNVVTQEDQEWWTGLQIQVRRTLGLEVQTIA